MKKTLLSLCILSSCVFANEGDIDKLFDLSLEDLMNIEVTTASQDKEKASESLAVVSVLTSTQLKQMGAINLYEALSFIPGVQINESYMGYTVLTFRGVLPGSYNNKALFMINGHPVHEKLFGSSHFEFIPIDMVDRIEVVRSPASVLYGTNAISGVVNIITKHGQEFSNEAAVRTGSHKNYYGSFNIHEAHLSMSASFQNDAGYTYGGVKDELGQDINIDYRNNLANLFVDLYGDKWRLQGAYYHSKKQKLGLNPIIQHGGLNDYEAFYFDANKAFNIGGGTLNIWLRYDNMQRNLQAQKFPNPVTGNPIVLENGVDRYSGEIQYKNVAFNNLRYLMGISYEYDRTDPMLFIDQTDGSIHPYSPFQEKYTTRNGAFYSEGKYRFDKKFVGVVGFRMEDNSATGKAFNPRMGVTYEYIPDTYFKLLYSEAYRSPTFLEKYANVTGILTGNKNLNREKIRTLELGVDSKINQNNSIQLTLYSLSLTDEITRRQASSGGTEYYNGSGIKTHGLEVALNTILNEKTELMINGAYVNGKHSSDEHNNLHSIAKYTANAILTYHLNTKWSSSLSSQYISKKDYTTNSNEAGSIPSYNLTNITVKYQARPFEANLYVKNIFNESYTYPEPTRNNIKEIPGGPGTTVYLTARYYF